MTLVMGLAFLVFLCMGLPIALGIGISAWIALLWQGTFPLTIVAHKMANGLNSFPLVAVPLFIMAGALAGETGIARRLVRFADVLVGHIRGGLGLVNVLACMFFGGISGSAVADAAAIGSLLIPAMKKDGYHPEFAAALTASASVTGILVPPSIPMVLYGVTMGVSVGALFIAGVIPGILFGLFLMAAVWSLARKHNYPKRAQRATAGELWAAFKDAFLALLLPVFLLVAIATGITTATEAGVIGVVYALFLGGAVYKEYEFRQLYSILVDSAVSTAIPCFLVATASVSAWIIAIEKLPDHIVTTLTAFGTSPLLLILFINIFLLFVGMFMELVPALILFAPILYPVALKAGVSPLQFGAILTVNLGIGLVTPPVGNCLFVACTIAKVQIPQILRWLAPFLLASLSALAIVSYVPWVSNWLPSVFYK